jgi:hypothetical protein
LSEKILRAAGFGSHVPVLFRGPDGPRVTLVLASCDTDRDELDEIVDFDVFDDPIIGAIPDTWSMEPSTFCGFVRDRLVTACLSLSLAMVERAERLSGLRLARLLRDVITGKAGDDSQRPPSHEDARRRIDLWRRAVREVPVPALPEGLLAAIASADLGQTYLWTPAVHCDDAILGAPYTCLLETSFLEWLDRVVLSPPHPALLDLLSCNPRVDVSSEDLDRALDEDFLRDLDASGGLVRATTVEHGGIEIQRVGRSLRLSVSIPEHIAGTDIVMGSGSRFVHWPATTAGIQIPLDESFSGSGILPNEYRVWNGEPFQHHPIVRVRSGVLPLGAGLVCVDRSAQYAAHNAIQLGHSPGLVVAAQLLEVRHTFLHGVNSTNGNQLFNRYSGVCSSCASNNLSIPYELLDEDAARRMSHERGIPLIRYWR